MIRDHLQLAVAETRLAVRGLVVMLVAGIMLAVILLTAWLGLSSLGVIYLLNAGADVSAAIVGLIGINLVIAATLMQVIRRQFAFLNLETTITSLSGRPPQDPAGERHESKLP